MPQESESPRSLPPSTTVIHPALPTSLAPIPSPTHIFRHAYPRYVHGPHPAEVVRGSLHRGEPRWPPLIASWSSSPPRWSSPPISSALLFPSPVPPPRTGAEGWTRQAQMEWRVCRGAGALETVGLSPRWHSPLALSRVSGGRLFAPPCPALRPTLRRACSLARSLPPLLRFSIYLSFDGLLTAVALSPLSFAPFSPHLRIPPPAAATAPVSYPSPPAAAAAAVSSPAASPPPAHAARCRHHPLLFMVLRPTSDARSFVACVPGFSARRAGPSCCCR
jgi:hypothetical protein